MTHQATLPPAICDALQALLRPPDDAPSAQALADALHRLVPEARVAYVLGARFRAWSPAGAPQQLREIAVDPGEKEGTRDGLVFRAVGAPFGTLGAAVPAELADAIQPRLRLAEALVNAGWLAEAHRDPQTRQMLTLAEAVGGLLHGLNNQLNGMVLQAAIVQAQAPEALRERAGAIRRLGADAARLAQPAQAVRPWPADGRTADPYVAFLEACSERDEPRVRAVPRGDGPAEVAASPRGLRRLFDLILRIARACAGPEAELEARFDTAPGRQFALLLPGVAAGAEGEEVALPPAGGPLEELQRQAAAWLAREQGSRLEVVPAQGGVELRLGWPPG